MTFRVKFNDMNLKNNIDDDKETIDKFNIRINLVDDLKYLTINNHQIYNYGIFKGGRNDIWEPQWFIDINDIFELKNIVNGYVVDMHIKKMEHISQQRKLIYDGIMNFVSRI